MSLRTLFSIVALTATGGGAALAAPPAAETPCFAHHSVTKVVPYSADFTAGQGTFTALVGARVFVPAEPGLTGEWLHAELARRVKNPGADPGCPLDVRGVTLNVQSAGPGFWVNIASKDRKAAKEVLRRAEKLSR